ncbi:alkaline phosphatase D family protein [soil metagenome]
MIPARILPFVVPFLMLALVAPAPAAEIESGPMLGHVTGSEAHFWIKASGEATVGIRLSTTSDLEDYPLADEVKLEEASDFMATVKVTGLEPATRYQYQITLDGEPEGGPAAFSTAPAEGEDGRVRIAFTSCIGREGALATAGWAEMAENADADLVLLLGDNHYADTTAREGQSAAYLDHRSVPGFRDLAPRVPIYAIWDDHDYGPNDSDGTADGKETSLATFQDFWANPSYGEPTNPGIYYHFQRSGIDFFMLDVRYHRSPNSAPDDDEKTVLGARQLEWLKDGLRASEAKIKIVASGSEWQMHGHRDSWTSFGRERAEILDFMRDEGVTGVLLISGDRHFTGGYQIRGEVIEVTSGPLGAQNYPTKNLPEMFLNQGEGKMFSVFEIDTAPELPKVQLEIHRAGAGIVERRDLTWPQILGEEKLEYLPVPDE